MFVFEVWIVFDVFGWNYVGSRYVWKLGVGGYYFLEKFLGVFFVNLELVFCCIVFDWW